MPERQGLSPPEKKDRSGPIFPAGKSSDEHRSANAGWAVKSFVQRLSGDA
jgi:hypothetical protein